ncbi:MAG TPA: glycosyltransferase [Verrucomicrobiae bacterium]
MAQSTEVPTSAASPDAGFRRIPGARLRAEGKFLFAGKAKSYLRGVTYGPFRPDPDGSEYHQPATVQRDFAQMRQCGINAIRTYTAPPRWLLDLAVENQLRVLVGIPWEQHVAFLSDRRRARDIQCRVQGVARGFAGHPAVLGYSIGNEIAAPIVRWYGHQRVEEYLQQLYWAAKAEDPAGLVTYVNYPSTEYLDLPFLDFVCFNVYLEQKVALEAYLARLQNIAGDKPLVMGEIGLDSARNGEPQQARLLAWQTETIWAGGCAGLFVFSWTDEWHRGGHDIEAWKFGLTTTNRVAKPALAEVQRAFREVPFGEGRDWPSISVVVCTFNGSRTLRECLAGLEGLQYPGLEIIVVDDGSTDSTATIVAEFDVRLIRIANGGLSNARNVGWQAAKGEIVAFLDDDAAPDAHWLEYLASTFLRADYAGVGGPNVAWPGDGLVAECVDHAPGNPTQVLLTDREAEHLPGCNMAFRKSCLDAVGGFDTRFRIAGDDVDLCWRLEQRGWKLGFHPAAMVWHHRRRSLRGYWRQQVNYGKAEAMLERKWPEKYNAAGHPTWNGRVYGKGPFSFLVWSNRRIYHGTWGTALFQSVYSEAPGTLASVLMLPEWYLVMVVLAVVSACSALYEPLRFALLLLALAFVPPLIHAARSGGRAFFHVSPAARWRRLARAGITATLHFMQPAARLWGRLCDGLTPWRRRGSGRLALPRPQSIDIWSDGNWRSASQRLADLEETLRASGAAVRRGGEFDRWDLEVRGGLLGTARLLMLLEEHGEGKQYVRIRLWPEAVPLAMALAALFAVLAGVAAVDLEWTAWALLNVPALILVGRTLYEAAGAIAATKQALGSGTKPRHPVTRRSQDLPGPEPQRLPGEIKTTSPSQVNG